MSRPADRAAGGAVPAGGRRAPVDGAGEPSARGDVPGVFVLGMPRSGTTLLARLLETGGPYVALPESHFFSRFVWTSLHRRSLAGLDAAWDAFVASGRWRLERRSGPAPVGGGATPAPERYRRVFLGWVTRELAAAGVDSGSIGWIENTPPHLEGVAFIRRVLPDARVVGVVRDPRAVHASLTRVDWNDAHPAANAERWRWYARALERRAHVEPERVHVVSYEALVRAPAETVAGVAEWLGVAFDATALERAGTGTRGFDVATEPWKARALQPPDPARIDDWRATLAPTDVAAIERWAWPAAGAYGYERVMREQGRAPLVERRAALAMRARLAVYAAATRLRVTAWRPPRKAADTVV